MNIAVLSLIALMAVVDTVACGGAKPSTPTSPTGPTSPTSPNLQIAGTYQITQTAVDDTCGQTGAPVPVTGTVLHTAGGATFTLNDTGGTSFSGTVERDGTFSATATFGPDAAGQTYAQRLEGRFTTTGFTATLRVDVSPRGCRFTRSWAAAKQGSPNVFP